MEYLLGIDAGGTRTKAALFDRRGRLIASVGRDTPLTITPEGWQERDMDQLWRLTADAVRSLMGQSGVPPEAVAGVGCCGHGKGLYLWGKDGRPAGPAIASTDRRAAPLAARWRADGTAARAAVRTLQSVTESQPAALLAWLKERRPQAYENIRWVLGAKDYLRFRLTGEALAERTDASGSSLLDLEEGRFSPKLLDLFGIPEMAACLPPLVSSAQPCGRVTVRAAEETGLRPGTPVCGGMFDIDACALAAGLTDGDSLCVIAGTWGINEYIGRRPAAGLSTARNSLYCLPGWYLIEESSPASAGNLEWVRRLLPPEHRDYPAINRLVDSVRPEDCPVIFAPYLYGSNVEGCGCGFFYGLDNSHTAAHLLRAVVEGVAFTHRIHVERLLRLRPPPRSVRLSGGAAASPVWAQLFADCLGLPVEAAPAGEPGALGAAMAAAAAAGLYPDCARAAEARAPERRLLLPRADRQAVYEEKYRRHLRLLRAVRNI